MTALIDFIDKEGKAFCVTVQTDVLKRIVPPEVFKLKMELKKSLLELADVYFVVDTAKTIVKDVYRLCTLTCTTL